MADIIDHSRADKAEHLKGSDARQSGRESGPPQDDPGTTRLSAVQAGDLGGGHVDDKGSVGRVSADGCHTPSLLRRLLRL